jgi:hypothetical protein
MIKLEEPDSAGPESQGAVVITGAAGDYLPQSCLDRACHLRVYESRPGRDTRLQPGRRTELHVPAQLPL